MLYLQQTELATDEDIANGLVYWAQLFQTSSWDDLKKLSQERQEFEEVAQIMYNSNIQSQERTLYEAHQKAMMDRRSLYNGGYRKGKEEGIEEGIKEGKKEAQAEIDRLRKIIEEAGIKAD